MSYQEKKSITSLITTIITFTIYYLVVQQRYPISVEMVEVLKYWGLVIIVLVPVAIVAQIVAAILFAIMNAIITQKEEKDIVDEFDKVIEQKAARNFSNVFLAGFFIAMFTLVFKMPIDTMFRILFFSLMTAGIVMDISTLVYYRRGV